MKIMPGPERDGTLLEGCAVLAIAKRKWAYGQLISINWVQCSLFDICTRGSVADAYPQIR